MVGSRILSVCFGEVCRWTHAGQSWRECPHSYLDVSEVSPGLVSELVYRRVGNAVIKRVISGRGRHARDLHERKINEVSLAAERPHGIYSGVQQVPAVRSALPLLERAAGAVWETPCFLRASV